MQSFKTPTSAQIEAALPLLASPDHERYFFRRLENPLWIEPLKKNGIFRRPPGAQTVDGGGMRCAQWPQSDYLKRMAVEAPGPVADVMTRIVTDNWIVAQDIIDAAKSMPVEHAAKLVPKIVELYGRVALWYKLDDIGTIVAKLAGGEQVPLAMTLTRAVFGVNEQTREGRRQRQDDYVYFKAMKESVIPALVAVQSTRFLAMMMDWMKRAVKREEEGNAADMEDALLLWRPAIEEHAQNSDSDFRSLFVGILREAFEDAIRLGGMSLEESLKRLEKGDLFVFKRLRIHLIAEFADGNSELARATMTDRSLIADHRVKHEYARLLGMRFLMLTDAQRTEWLQWIDGGPTGFDLGYYTNPDDADLCKRQCDWWKFEKLYWVRAYLDGTQHSFYKEMHKKHGDPKLADVNVYSSGRWGSRSGITVEEFQKMGFEEAIKSATTWSPPPERDIEEPTVHALAQTFATYVSTDVPTFSTKAPLLRKKHAVWVNSYLGAIREGVKRGLAVDLGPVFELCEWVVGRPVNERMPPMPQGPGMIDVDWKWTRDEIANLVETICDTGTDGGEARFGEEFRGSLWKVTKELVEKSSASYGSRPEKDEDPQSVDWAFRMLNAPRGKAMLALFAYADWVACLNVGARKNYAKALGGFDAMPEVRELLEAQLVREDDHFTGRAVFGWRFWLLYNLDGIWTRKNAAKIFDLRSIERDRSKAYGWAAWSTFLYGNRAHREFYELLHEQFSYAVDSSKDVKWNDREREQPFARLGEHLMILYGRGELGGTLDDAWKANAGILRRLVVDSPVGMRSHAMQFVGQSVGDAGAADLPPMVVERFRDLWERYWQEVGEKDAAANPTSHVFGWWFKCEAFDKQWLIEQMEKFLNAAPSAGPEHLIVDRLAEVCAADPARCVRIVEIMAESNERAWWLSAWKENVGKVLETAVNSGGEARDVAAKLIDQLARRGLTEFGKLIGFDVA